MYLACQSLDSTIPMFYIPRCERFYYLKIIQIDTLEYNTSFLNEDEKVVLPLLSKWNVVCVLSILLMIGFLIAKSTLSDSGLPSIS